MFLRSLLVRYLLNIALEHQIYLQNTAHVKWSFYSVSSSRSYSNKIKSYLLLLHKLQKFCCFSTSFIFRFICLTCCNNYQINALRRLLIHFHYWSFSMNYCKYDSCPARREQKSDITKRNQNVIEIPIDEHSIEWDPLFKIVLN